MERSTEQFIENLYRKNYHRLYVHACSILGQSSEAEAAVQEAFLAACKKPDKFIRSESHIGWLKRAVENITYFAGAKVFCGAFYVDRGAFSWPGTSSFGG